MADNPNKFKDAILRYRQFVGNSSGISLSGFSNSVQGNNGSDDHLNDIESGKNFKVTQDGTTLNIEFGQELTTANAPALTEELSAYRGQDIEKVVFDASRLLIFSSSGIRVLFYVNEKIGHHPEIVFVNCADEIYESIDYVGLTKSITFVENENKHAYRPKKALENYAANNDVVCYQMKLGELE